MEELRNPRGRAAESGSEQLRNPRGRATESTRMSRDRWSFAVNRPLEFGRTAPGAVIRRKRGSAPALSDGGDRLIPTGRAETSRCAPNSHINPIKECTARENSTVTGHLLIVDGAKWVKCYKSVTNHAIFSPHLFL